MKIGIHHRKNSFSDRWVKYCEKNKINYKIVDCYDNDIINQLGDCNGFMWHMHHADTKSVLFGKQLIYSIEKKAIKVFPDFNTVWHFDDKLGQKYLLESVNSPLVKSYAFYDLYEAINWAENTIFPKVFKLRGGAGSRNVKLIKDLNSAKKIIRKCFSGGHLLDSKYLELEERYLNFISVSNINNFIRLIKGLGRIFFPTPFQRLKLKEKGYCYFQDFIPDNSFDIRIVIIGERAIALKRLVRFGDFRASGSGKIIYVGDEIDHNILAIAFKTSESIKSQCMAYDFVINDKNEPLIVEISFAFSMLAYDKCPGFWDRELKWHQSEVDTAEFIIEDFIKLLSEN